MGNDFTRRMYPDATINLIQYQDRGDWHSFWTLCGGSDNNRNQFSTRFEALQFALQAGYIVVRYNEDGSIDIHHPETQYAIDRNRAHRIDSMGDWHRAKPCYVRFGKLPASGKSFNYRDNEAECGVSVYRAYRIGAEVRLDLRDIDIAAFSTIRFRDAYIVTGQEVGTGADGEPCLANPRIWRKAKSWEVMPREWYEDNDNRY